MTARPLRAVRGIRALRVVQGKVGRRPVLAPWLAFCLVVVVALVGQVVARTALDRGAVGHTELERRIAVEQTRNQELRLEVSRLESPTRVGPLAEDLGMVYPDERIPIVVAGVNGPGPTDDPRWARMDRYAAAFPESP